MTRELIQLKSKDIKPLRTKLLNEQNGNCKLCGETINDESGISLDHQHMTSKEIIGEDGAGLVRGVLCRSCNVLEGKIWNNVSRYKQPENVADRIHFLESLISYYKESNTEFIHPNEEPKEPIVSKRNYNKLKKIYTGRKKFPEYPKSKKLTVQLKQLFKEYSIEPFN